MSVDWPERAGRGARYVIARERARAIDDCRLVWWLENSLHDNRESIKRISEPKTTPEL
jgi:hypothetical protein